LSAIWGSAFIAIKISVEFINPFSVASLRLILGAFFLFVIFSLKKYSFNISKKNIILIILIGVIGNFIPFSLISWSELYVQSNVAGLLLSVGPLFTLVLSHFLTKDDKFTLIKFISISIGFLGVLIIIGFDTILNLVNGDAENLFPKIAIVLSALGYSISSILAYNIKNLGTIQLTTFVTISAAIVSIPFMVIGEIQSPSFFHLNSVLAIIYLGLFPTALAFQLRFYLISKAGPIFLSYVAYLIPIFAIIWGYIFLKEVVSFEVILGVVLVLVGVFISQKKTKNTNV